MSRIEAQFSKGWGCVDFEGQVSKHWACSDAFTGAGSPLAEQDLRLASVADDVSMSAISMDHSLTATCDDFLLGAAADNTEMSPTSNDFSMEATC